MSKKAVASVANRSKIVTKSTFNNYDACINPYVGCEFGCSYCYVRFFVKDPVLPWGEFVRVRAHIEDSLPKELSKGFFKFQDGRQSKLDESGNQCLDDKNVPISVPKHKIIKIQDTRLVLGTMTDPYQPKENKFKLTRKVLEILLRPGTTQFQKVGIFTRSPLVLRDLDLIKQLPKARVHFTITPLPHDIMRVIEPFSSLVQRRWDTIRKLKEAGIRVHVNVSPVIPMMSEPLIDEWVQNLVDIGCDEYFVDPMQPYADSFEAFKQACATIPSLDWNKIQSIMTNKNAYLDWKFDFFQQWNNKRKQIQHLAPDQLPIWSDHENKIWVDMRTGQQMDRRSYGSN